MLSIQMAHTSSRSFDREARRPNIEFIGTLRPISNDFGGSPLASSRWPNRGLDVSVRDLRADAPAPLPLRCVLMEPSRTEISDGETTWRFDRAFLKSNWTCIWGRGCQGILPQPAADLNHGCCSIGADLDGDDEARRIGALAATLEPCGFEFHAMAAEGGVFKDATRSSTRVVDGACIFLNRVGFDGGAGCALHLAALRSGESPIDFKPSVCWQLPIKVDWETGEDGTEVATVRGWTRGDWGPEGDTMAWCCTEDTEAYVGDQPVIESMAEEMEAIVGSKVYVELRRRLKN
jgi:hypothetical protein